MTAEGPAPTVTRSRIAGAVRELGLARGDVVLAHSSLKSFGHVDGGADAVIDALLDVLGPDGLLIMPTFTRCRVDSTRKEPAEPFDPEETSCRARTGVIPDTFRRRPGTRRSLHPTHSLVAFGRRAEEFVAEGERRTFDPEGPYGRYARWNGKALFLGAGLGSNTTVHCAEDWMGLPFLSSGRALVKAGDGAEEVAIYGHPIGCRSFYGGDGGVVGPALEAAGIIRQASINATRLRLIEAREVVRVCSENEEREPGFLLCRETPHEFCREGLAASIRERDRILARIADLRAGGWAPAPR